MNANDHFRAASVTKPMVATIVLQLVDEKKLALDARLSTYLPGIVANAENITVRQLLNHTAGVPAYNEAEGFLPALYADPGRIWTTTDLLAYANGLPRLFEPGAPGKFAYSNTDYIVLGALIEKVTASTLARELQTRLFDRLQMTGSSYSTTTTLPESYAQGYADVSATQLNFPVGTVLSPTWGAAAGAVVSTVADLARFTEALASGSLVSAASRSAQTQLVADIRFRFDGDTFDSGYGLGVIVGDGWIGHNGAIPGYEIESYSKPGVGSIVVMVNRTTGNDASHAILAAVRAAEFSAR
jgi:D-alanyl-D-alanine carboxypeptidase